MLQTFKDSAHKAKYLVKTLVNLTAAGKTDRECTCCGQVGKFYAFGHPPRYEAQCTCGALERHRLFVIAAKEFKIFRPLDSVLHFAPEPVLTKWIKDRVSGYHSADLSPGSAELVRNIEAVDEPDNSVDVVVANHILEHVDDTKALAEIYRILKPSGILMACTPIIEGWAKTYENESVKTPTERAIHFGQSDHVRLYGRDIRDRMRAARFGLEEYVASPGECVRYGLQPGESIMIGRKPVQIESVTHVVVARPPVA